MANGEQKQPDQPAPEPTAGGGSSGDPQAAGAQGRGIPGPSGGSAGGAGSELGKGGGRLPGGRVRRRYGVAVPTREALDALPAEKRLELISQARAARHQVFTTLGLVLTVVLTAIGLYFTQRTLVSTQEGQITDRYTKAVEQLASGKREVRTAAIYALERIAHDSKRDRPAIRDVLAAFVREHDPAPTVREDKLPNEPDTDVAAALTVLVRRPSDPTDAPPLDLHSIRVPRLHLPPHANLRGANLSFATLDYVSLKDADLTGADLSHADLTEATLENADLNGTDLRSARLLAAHLQGAQLLTTRLERAYLRQADLSFTTSLYVDLSGASLQEANLLKAHLINPTLVGADLRGADLRGISGMGPEQVKHENALVDATTRFSQ